MKIPRPKLFETLRMNQNDWAAMAFSYAGNYYPLAQYSGYSAFEKKESISNDFVSYVQQGYQSNGVVFAASLARMLVFTEARFQWQKMRNGRPGDLWGNQQLSILETPWTNGTTADLLGIGMQDADFSGNYYVVERGSARGGDYHLKRMRPDWVDIILTKPPAESLDSDIAGWVFKPGGSEDPTTWEIFPADGSNGRVVHWAPIRDPLAQYRGMSWLTPVLREIQTDTLMQKHKQKFFENGTQPTLAISFKESVTEQQFKDFVGHMNNDKSGVDHAYENLYLGGGADVTVIGSRIDQIDFKTTGGHGETRVCMAARVHPTIVGLAEALHGTSLNEGNLKAAKDMFGDMTLRPLWRSFCEAFQVLFPGMQGSRLWYDDRDIAFLRQDRQEVAEIQTAQSTSLNSLITAGFTPESSIEAIKNNDWTLLKHTGLFSVQLQPPGTIKGDANNPGDPNSGANEPDANEDPGNASPDAEQEGDGNE